ncbi:PREDICTED: tudor domain-containing protein 1-like [Rhagoletis zephyria]|uniref:tudor domain-containing protein 1-like n=1 Tax=Rhagoletis zephyria TaxID=28612 RepID=UPI0008118F2A|nr:PREDICTED: tudor domain-containing protein 1-like [Rhagoletis zephyria]
MAFRSNMDRMQTMHLMCKRELEQLQANLSRFLIDSEVVMRNEIFKNSRKESGFPLHGNVFALMAYDRYMSRVASVTNLARKFNIHLQLHNLNKILTGGDVGSNKTNLLEEFVEWHKALRDNDVCQDYGGGWEHYRSNEDEGSTAALPLADPITTDNKVKVCDAMFPFARKITFARPESLTLEALPSCVQLRDLSGFVAGYHFAAFITYIDNIDTLTFYACQMRNDMLYELSNMLNLPKSVRIPPRNFVFGISINSKSILRGVIQTPECVSHGSTEDNIHVLLIDYGELVPLNSNEVQFYDLPKMYRDLPAQAIKCILLGVKDAFEGCNQTDACLLGKKLRKYEFKEVTFEVVRKTGRVLYVYIIESREMENLPAENKKRTNVSNNPFVNSFDENSNGDDPPQKAKFGSNNNLKFLLTARIDEISKDDIIQLEVMHIARPDCFYGQILKDKTEQLEQLFWNTDEILLEQKLTEPPKLGDVILAQYAKDEFWYRAKVIDMIDDGTFKVFYVDYGNTDMVPLKSMARCNHEQEVEPFRAVLCRLDGVIDITNGDKSRFEQAVQMLVVTLLNQRFKVQVIQKNNDEELTVRLLDKEFVETTQMLVNLGFAKQI